MLNYTNNLTSGIKGLILFAPLMKPPVGVEDKGWLRQCFEVANSVSQDTVSKADYLTDVAILSGLIFDFTTIRETIMETIMQESSVIQHFLQQGIEQGIEQGARNSLIEGILENLEIRFHAPNLQEIKEMLDEIHECE